MIKANMGTVKKKPIDEARARLNEKILAVQNKTKEIQDHLSHLLYSSQEAIESATKVVKIKSKSKFMNKYSNASQLLESCHSQLMLLSDALASMQDDSSTSEEEDSDDYDDEDDEFNDGASCVTISSSITPKTTLIPTDCKSTTDASGSSKGDEKDSTIVMSSENAHEDLCISQSPSCESLNTSVPPKSPKKKHKKVLDENIVVPSYNWLVDVPYPVLISDFNNPYDFSIQLVNSDNDIMERLCLEFMKEAANDYKGGIDYVPNCGLFCCVKSTVDGAWYRGKIIQVYVGSDGDNEIEIADVAVKVLFIDEGFTSIVSLSQLRSLDKRFAILPSQSFHCVLSGVKPTTSSLESNQFNFNSCKRLWSSSVATFFKESYKDGSILSAYLRKAPPDLYSAPHFMDSNTLLCDLYITKRNSQVVWWEVNHTRPPVEQNISYLLIIHNYASCFSYFTTDLNREGPLKVLKTCKEDSEPKPDTINQTSSTQSGKIKNSKIEGAEENLSKTPPPKLMSKLSKPPPKQIPKSSKPPPKQTPKLSKPPPKQTPKSSKPPPSKQISKLSKTPADLIPSLSETPPKQIPNSSKTPSELIPSLSETPLELVPSLSETPGELMPSLSETPLELVPSLSEIPGELMPSLSETPLELVPSLSETPGELIPSLNGTPPKQIPNSSKTPGELIPSLSGTPLELILSLSETPGELIPYCEDQKDNENLQQSENGRASAEIEPSFCFSDSLKEKELVKSVNDFMKVVVSEIVSPAMFYMHVITPEVACFDEMMEQLNIFYDDHYDAIKSAAGLKIYPIGNSVVARSLIDNKWYRGTVVNHTHDCMYSVLFVDFGGEETVSGANILPICDQFCELPKEIIACCLADIEPLPFCLTKQRKIEQSDDLNDEAIVDDAKLEWREKHTWSDDAIAKFKCFTGDNRCLVASLKSLQPNERGIYMVNLYDTTGKKEVCVNQHLVDEGLATSQVFITLQTCANDSNARVEDSLCLWDPMKEQFESSRNSYAVDIDDPNIATLGLVDNTKRVCRAYSRYGHCCYGNRCRFLHVQEGDPRADQVDVFSVDNMVVLPKVGDWVAVTVTSMIDPTHLWLNFPYGLTIDHGFSKTHGNFEALNSLNKDMQDYYSRMQRNDETDLTILAESELIAAYFNEENRWYRAKVLNHADGYVQVYFIDYGDVGVVEERDVRKLLPDFLHLPAQAVECFLHNVAVCMDTFDRHNMFEDERFVKLRYKFRDFIADKVLMALVWARNANSLVLELYDTSMCPHVNLNEMICKWQGFVPTKTMVDLKKLVEQEKTLRYLPG